ncbi:uncharacterized protein K02A2.6-like [Lineus longissimus]|uniref:uncharacterized protein K02A2.6-like n=1 Tax=Lineus longissimus TaxID=88925 RepID=UPI00315D0759
MVNVQYEDQHVNNLPLYVVRSDGPALFGRDWLQFIRLNWDALCVNRVNSILDNHNGDQLPELSEILEKHKDAFKSELGKAKNFKVELRVKSDATPIFFKARPVPYAILEDVKESILKEEREGILERVEYSDWAAPIVPVRKPDGSIRVCGDFKVTINKYIENPEHPMPHMDELYQKLKGGEKFSKLNLPNAYKHIEVEDESRKYLTINTPLGLFRCTRLAFGVNCAPQLFQSMMDKVL